MNPRFLVPALALAIPAACLVLLVAQESSPPQQAEAVPNDESVALFDGETLAGWEGDPKLWRVEDGAITGETTAESPIDYNTFLKWTDGELDDFELTLEYRIFSGNSGVQIRSFALEKEHAVGGYQADIDAEGKWTGTNYGEQFRGILAKRGEKTVIREGGKPEVVGSLGDADELGKVLRPGEWNTYRIVAQGNKIVCEINGKPMSEIVDEDAATRRRAGLLAFQLHKGQIGRAHV